MKLENAYIENMYKMIEGIPFNDNVSTEIHKKDYMMKFEVDL